MKTQTPSPAEMNKRLARFNALDPLPVLQNSDMPLAARDIIYSRKLMPVITLDQAGDTPIAKGAPITGAGGITMTWAVIPPGTGPSLHNHDQTFETFTVVEGEVEFTWGDSGEHSLVLGRFDVLSIPPRTCRAFKNVGTTDAIIQVVISGGVHDMKDIAFPPSVADKLAGIGPQYLNEFKEIGFSFDATSE